MHTRTNEELEAVYKAGHAHSHASGIREVYQAGRADEQLALKEADEKEHARRADELAPKRPIQSPGEPVDEVEDPGEVEVEDVEMPSDAAEVGYTDEGPVPVPQRTAPAPAAAKPRPKVNAAPGTPAPGQNPPGEHPPSAA